MNVRKLTIREYHDDGEMGLGPTIATFSAGAPSKMMLRLKTRWFTGERGGYILEEPVPGSNQYALRLALHRQMLSLPIEDRKRFADAMIRQHKLDKCKKRNADPCITLHLNHGDMVIMHGAALQKYFEHSVQSEGKLRFALTARYISPNHLRPDELPEYTVEPDPGSYDGGPEMTNE